MSSAAPAPASAPPVAAPPVKKSRTDGVEYNFCYALKQQLLRAWQPVPTLGCGIIMFFLLGIAFGGGGVYLYILNGQIWEVRERYDQKCGALASCEITFTVSADQPANTYIYYEIQGFYQSHRKFFGSKHQLQLTGQPIVETDAASCKPVIKNSDLYKKTNWNNSLPLDPTKVAYPCGAFARSIFNGSYKVTVQNNWPVSGFGGQKYFVITQANMFGGKNTLLCFMYLGLGALMLLTAIIFGVRKGMRSGGILEANLK